MAGHPLEAMARDASQGRLVPVPTLQRVVTTSWDRDNCKASARLKQRANERRLWDGVEKQGMTWGDEKTIE